MADSTRQIGPTLTATIRHGRETRVILGNGGAVISMTSSEFEALAVFIEEDSHG